MIGALIGAGLSLAGSIYGQAQAAKAQRKYEDYAKSSMAANKLDLESTFNRRNSQDYMDTEAAKVMQKRFNDYAKTTRESIQGQAIAAGATPEAVVAQQKGLSDSYNSMLDSLASKSTAYKLQNQNAYDAQKSALRTAETNMNLGMLGAKINSGNNIAGGFAAAGQGIADADAEGAFKGLFKKK